MKSNPLTIEDVLTHSRVRPLLAEGDVDRILDHLRVANASEKEPVYIRILVGIGAWFAALCLILFLAVASLIDSGAGAVLWGGVMLGAAVVPGRWRRGIFVSQLSLAMAIAGNLLVLFGFAEYSGFDEIGVIVFAHAVITLLMYPLYSNSTYRFLSPTALAALVVFWIVDARVSVWFHGLAAAEIVLVGTLFLSRRRMPALEPLAYSAALMLPVVLLILNLSQAHLWRTDFNEPLWPSNLILALGLIILYLYLAGVHHLRDSWMILAVTATLLLGVFTTPGILVAVGLLVMGYAFGDRVLSAFAFLFLPLFLVVFYYALNIDLAYKSAVVAGSGVLLLLVRKIAGWCRPDSAEKSADPFVSGKRDT